MDSAYTIYLKLMSILEADLQFDACMLSEMSLIFVMGNMLVRLFNKLRAFE